MSLSTKLKLAVALKYKFKEDVAPMVLAGGSGRLAEALVAKAREYDIPIHENGPLAEALSRVETGQAVPEELFELVAQVMAMIYNMDAKLGKEAGAAPENFPVVAGNRNADPRSVRG